MSSIIPVCTKIAVSHQGSTVLIELICKNELGAVVLYDDVVSRLTSESGISLFIKSEPANDGAKA